MARADLKLGDMDLVEVNEAFAPQVLAVEKELGLDRAKTNLDGGAQPSQPVHPRLNGGWGLVTDDGVGLA